MLYGVGRGLRKEVAADVVIAAEEGRQVLYGVGRGLRNRGSHPRRLAADVVIAAEEGRQVLYGVEPLAESPPTS